jgi:carboxyl-terminal processing protease
MLVDQYFAHWDGASRAHVQQAYLTYSRSVTPSTDRRAFDLATLRFLAALHNGHTQFADSALDSRPLKFRLLEVERRWVVVFSQDRRLPRGAIVRFIGGRPVETVVHELSQYVGASSKRLAQTHVFSYPGLFPERIELGLEGGETLVVDRATPADALPPAPQQTRWLIEDRLAYIRAASFGDPAFEAAAVDSVRRFKDAGVLIIDVRGNGGGATPGRLVRALMNRRWRTWRQIAPSRVDSREQAVEADAFSGRLLILVDRFCGSACEDFVMPFKDTGRATIIGETTQGSSGNPYRMNLGDGMSVAIGAVRYAFPDGKAFESVGIEPDVPVQRRIADIAAGRDAVLERAQQLAGSYNRRP